MNGWSPSDFGLSKVVGASETNTVVSKPFRLSSNGALHLVVKIVAASTTVATGITAKLQTAMGDDWVDSKTVSISGNGNFYIKLLCEAAGDQTYLPLLSQGRIVVSSGAGDAVTISQVSVLQDE